MNPGGREPGTWRPWAPWLALVLWIASALLGMQALVAALALFYLLFGYFGWLALAEQFAIWLLFFLGLLLVGVVIGSAEYHRTHVDQPRSWRLFAWTLGLELAIVLLHYFLLL